MIVLRYEALREVLILVEFTVGFEDTRGGAGKILGWMSEDAEYCERKGKESEKGEDGKREGEKGGNTERRKRASQAKILIDIEEREEEELRDALEEGADEGIPPHS